MQRTMAASGPSRACMLVMVIPAAMEMTSARRERTARAILLMASAITCGLTAMITTSAAAAASGLSAHRFTGAISRRRSRLGANGSAALILPAGWPLSISPPMMLLAMLPAPINAMWGMFKGAAR